MKRILFYSCLIVAAFAGCKKNKLAENQIWNNSPATYANIRFYNAFTALTPSAGIPANGPSVDIFVNNVRINGAAGGLGVAYGGVFPTATGTYANIPAGTLVNFKVVLNRVAGGATPSDTIVNTNLNLGPLSQTTLFLTDSLPVPISPTNPFLVTVGESVSPPITGKFKMRFVNMVANGDTLGVYSRRNGALVADNIVYRSLSPWIELPLPPFADTLDLRKTGTVANISSVSNFTGGNQRSYTFIARGNTNVAGRTRTLTFYTSQ